MAKLRNVGKRNIKSKHFPGKGEVNLFHEIYGKWKKMKMLGAVRVYDKSLWVPVSYKTSSFTIKAKFENEQHLGCV